MENRINWTNQDWASYLQCPVEKIPEFKKILDENYVIGIERNKINMQYSNNVISHLELNEYAAKSLNVPKQAIQMMLIHQK